ncbi:hypothetical protein D3C77_601190 [compost metagenome]
MKSSPPLPSVFVRKIREYTWARPYITHVIGSIWSLTEASFLNALLIDFITILNFDSRINNRYNTNAKLLELLHHPSWFRKTFRIERKYFIIRHIMNIEINDITRNLLISKIMCQLHHFFLIHITESRLLVS